MVFARVSFLLATLGLVYSGRIPFTDWIHVMHDSSNSLSLEDDLSESPWDPLSQLPDSAIRTMMEIKPSEEARGDLDIWTSKGDQAPGNAEETGKYFEGDMVLVSPKKIRNGLRAEASRWTKGRVPYVITGHFTKEEHNLIHKAMWAYGNRTCVRWVDVHKNPSPDYVVITSERTGCWSNVGRVGGEQQLNLERPGCVRTEGTVIHEMMHTLGFVHEQNRYERDDWIDIHWENMQQGKEANFVKMKKQELNPFGVKYDYRSVMHYSSTAFSKNGKPTILPKKGRPDSIGQREGFSDGDVRKIKAMYCH